MINANEKDAFLQQIGDIGQLLPLLDTLQDVAFFVKDRKSRMIMNNLRAVASCGVATEEESTGTRGEKFFAAERLMLYLAQDEKVMRTGKPILNAICPTPERGSNAVIIYSKVPLRDKQGRVIGLAGIWREVKGMELAIHTYGSFSRVVQCIHEKYAEPITVEQLAQLVGLSRSNFTRQFRRLFGDSPHDYLLRVRLNAAAHLLLESQRKTTDIALETGFYDHSHFSRSFRQFMGCSPQVYRTRYRKNI